MRKQREQEIRKEFPEILRERKLKFQRDQRALEKMLKDKQRRKDASIINPERFSSQGRYANREKKEQFTQTQQSIQVATDRLTQQQAYQSPKLEEIKRQYLLRQKAHNFIQRLKKQKEYNQGRYLMIRRREQLKKQQQKSKLDAIRKEMIDSFNRKKMQKVMMNIMIHESRIRSREDQSMCRQMRKSKIRSKTQNQNRSESVRPSLQINKPILNEVYSYKKPKLEPLFE